VKERKFSRSKFYFDLKLHTDRIAICRSASYAHYGCELQFRRKCLCAPTRAIKRRPVGHAAVDAEERSYEATDDDSDVTVENKAVTRQYGYWYRALARSRARARVRPRRPRPAVRVVRACEPGHSCDFRRQFFEVQRHVYVDARMLLSRGTQKREITPKSPVVLLHLRVTHFITTWPLFWYNYATWDQIRIQFIRVKDTPSRNNIINNFLIQNFY